MGPFTGCFPTCLPRVLVNSAAHYKDENPPEKGNLFEVCLFSLKASTVSLTQHSIHRKFPEVMSHEGQPRRGGRRLTFEQSYRCYPASFIDKPHMELGDKVVMPPSALDRLASLHVDYPMLFELNNPSAGRVTHCGVLEFIADEGLIYLPYWMMQNMLLQEGEIVQVKNASLSKGTYVKLQPHTKDFLDISNPKAILETALRSFSCLTIGDTIMVAYNNKNYYIDIIDAKPSSSISIIETDCEVDFAPPLDYKEPEKPAKSTLSKKRPPEVEEEPPLKIAKINPFSGASRRLDGKPPTPLSEQASSHVLKQSHPEMASIASSSTAASTSWQHSGKLVFGSNVSQVPLPSEKSKISPKDRREDVPQKAEESKFQAFTGKRYSLKD